MTELLQIGTLILLVFIWRSVGRLLEQTAILLHGHRVLIEEKMAKMREHLESMDSRLKNIEELIDDHFETPDWMGDEQP